VSTGVLHTPPTSYLVETRPGCNSPDIIEEMYTRTQQSRPDRVRLARLSGDEVRNDAELVTRLTTSWTSDGSKRPELREGWLHKREDAKKYGEDWTEPIRLLVFVECAKDYELRLIAFIKKFDRLFERVSCEMLAQLRNLENQGRLACVNASPLPYDELYRRRARVDPGFTSDYGQTHPRIPVELWTRDEAWEQWAQRFRLSKDPKDVERLHRSYFETAFDSSGGLPLGFEKAMNIAMSMEMKEDIREFRAALADQLPETFSSILRDSDESQRYRLIEAVAHLHTGTATASHRRTILGHRFRDQLFQGDEGDPRILCDALGRRALQMLRDSDGLLSCKPADLYREGQYKACLDVIERGRIPEPLLEKAARMMDLVFRDSPMDLYFQPGTRWGEVEKLANECAGLCTDDLSRKEFESWRRIASVHRALPKADRAEIDKHLKQISVGDKPQAVSDAMIHLGIRLLAVSRDRNPLSAAHMAIPLPEHAIRLYVVLVLEVRPDGSAFEAIPDEAIHRWWGDRSKFERPAVEERLSGAALALLAAILSEQRNKPLFRTREDLHRLRSMLDDTRNLLGHNVTAPPTEARRRLAEAAKETLERLAEHGGSTLMLKDVEDLVKQPKQFLVS